MSSVHASALGMFGCAVCQMSFASGSELREHMSCHAADVMRPYSCSICRAKFAAVHSLNQHISSHNLGSKYRCTLCKIMFNDLAQLDDHIEYHKSGGHSSEAVHTVGHRSELAEYTAKDEALVMPMPPQTVSISCLPTEVPLDTLDKKNKPINIVPSNGSHLYSSDGPTNQRVEETGSDSSDIVSAHKFPALSSIVRSGMDHDVQDSDLAFDPLHLKMEPHIDDERPDGRSPIDEEEMGRSEALMGQVVQWRHTEDESTEQHDQVTVASST